MKEGAIIHRIRCYLVLRGKKGVNTNDTRYLDLSCKSQGFALRRSGYLREVIHYRVSAFFHYDPAEKQTSVCRRRSLLSKRRKALLRV